MAVCSYRVNSSVDSPLYFFYDCEATGPQLANDRIIEIAAVLYVKNLSYLTRAQLRELQKDPFESLCYTNKSLHQFVITNVGLTLAQLRYQPKFEKVFEQFLDWISRKKAEVEKQAQRKFTPVLVAHSGNSHDFPQMLKEVERTTRDSPMAGSALLAKLYSTDLHFADTFLCCKELEKQRSSILWGVTKLGVEALWNHFFPLEPFTAHRALPDAIALCKLFTDSPLSHSVDKQLKNTIQNLATMQVTRIRAEKESALREAGISWSKAQDLIQKGITVEDMKREYRSGPLRFRSYLGMLGIHKPKIELLNYFSTNTYA